MKAEPLSVSLRQEWHAFYRLWRVVQKTNHAVEAEGYWQELFFNDDSRFRWYLTANYGDSQGPRCYVGGMMGAALRSPLERRMRLDCLRRRAAERKAAVQKHLMRAIFGH